MECFTFALSTASHGAAVAMLQRVCDPPEWRCSHCKSTDIQTEEWVTVNGGVVQWDRESETFYCGKCAEGPSDSAIDNEGHMFWSEAEALVILPGSTDAQWITPAAERAARRA